MDGFFVSLTKVETDGAFIPSTCFMQPTGIYVGVIRKVMTMNKSTSIHDIKKDTPMIQALQEALECGIVNMDNVQEQLMASKREQVKKIEVIRTL